MRRVSRQAHVPEYSVECMVLGAGVVGLAVARALSAAGREVVVVEASDGIGTGQSSRNSEVIHAGIYYPKDSNKARMCVEGKNMLYSYLSDRNLPHKRLGKLIIARNDQEVETLKEIKGKGEANGVEGLQLMSGEEAMAMEPNIECRGAILSPTTGIIDSHAYMRSLQGDAEEDGCSLAFGSSVVSGNLQGALDGQGPIVLDIDDGSGTTSPVGCTYLVNSCGIDAVGVCKSLEGFPQAHLPPCHYAKGRYFSLAGSSPFHHLIYPVPVPGGLGTHSTLDMGGQVKFGPDVTWLDSPNYIVEAGSESGFYSEIREWYPGLKDGSLTPGYAGIRAKISGKGEPAADFLIQGEREHGIPGLVNLFGIESPGLTSSLAIARHVARMLS